MRDMYLDTSLHSACKVQGPGLEMAVGLLVRWGADETAWDKFGRTPMDLLYLARPDGERLCSQEEVERARLLLTRAPTERAWRGRRGWLVMLRSRAVKATGVSDDTTRNDDGGGSDVDRGR